MEWSLNRILKSTLLAEIVSKEFRSGGDRTLILFLHEGSENIVTRLNLEPPFRGSGRAWWIAAPLVRQSSGRLGLSHGG
jgi:hypothetical protein